MMLPRKPFNEIGYAYRHHGFSTKDLKRLEKLKNMIFHGKMQLSIAQNDDLKAIWNVRLGFLCHKYFHLRYRVFEKKTTRINRVVEIARTIESFSPNSCWTRFRTRKEDLPKLLPVFQLELPPVQ